MFFTFSLKFYIAFLLVPKTFLENLCLNICTICEKCLQRAEVGVGSRRVGVTDDCDPPKIGAGTQFWVFWKSLKHSCKGAMSSWRSLQTF